MNNSKAHQELLHKVMLEVGSEPFIRVWKNATGTARSFDGKSVISYGLVGSSDIMGIVKHRRRGIFLSIEIKTGSARQTKPQEMFEYMVKQFNGVYVIVREPGTALKLINDELDLMDRIF